MGNLQHHPVPALVLSAFLPGGWPFAWLAPIALTMFGANRAVGNARLALVCAAGHLVGATSRTTVLTFAAQPRPGPVTGRPRPARALRV